MRSQLDALKLIWPITGGYKLFLPSAANRAWPVMRRAASAYRRLVIPRTCVIAVIGSLGKTTTRRMVRGALGGRLARHSKSNYGVRLAANLLRVRPWHREAVLEVGIAGPGRMGPFGRMIRPDIVVVTSVRSDHNRSFETLEDTRAEKVKMVRALAPEGLAVLNGDDPHVRWMATQTRARIVTYGFDEGNDVRAADLRPAGASGSRFTLHAGGVSREASIRLLGRHMVYPALAAAAVGLARGRTLEELLGRLAGIGAEPGRLQPLTVEPGVTVICDDYKSSIETIVAAFDAVAAVPAARRVVVLGSIQEPPEHARGLYRELGAHLAGWAQRVILIGSDEVASLIPEAVRRGMDRAAVTHVGSSVHEAIALLRRELAPGDLLLLKGAGAQRFDRIVLALQGRAVRCPVKICKVKPFIPCEDCPMLARDRAAFENVHLRKLVRFSG
jgi:UDP-N-acetylmuramyl pentapeptide synthase